MKKQALIGALAMGAMTVGSLLQTTSSASAATVGTTTTSCDFAGATICTNVLNGNDSLSDLNSIDDSPFSNYEWEFLSKINAPNTTPDEGIADTFKLTYNGDPDDSTSGTWEILLQNIINNKSPFVLAMKAGGGYAYNFFDGTVFSGNWDTDRFLNPKGIPQGISHATLYTPKDFQPIPTPALLPGLIGMGLAAMRKKKQAAEVTQEV